MLRAYQQRTLDDLYAWFRRNEGHPAIVMPTGAGKSHIIAALCHDALTTWPETQILMLSHVRELISQNAEKLRLHWPQAPLGIYSAGLKSRNLDQITFAGIQSVHNRADEIGHVDLVIIDECHLIGHKDAGIYRKLITILTEINPALRVIGLTATPYRLGHGMITDPPAIFNGLIESVSIEELVYKGFLAPLRSKLTGELLDVAGVKKRGGEYIESELQAAVNIPLKNQAVVEETIKRAGDRRAWLFFCAGVAHAHAINELLQGQGVPSACITGETPTAERDEILTAFKAGGIRAITNANILTTGFDYPDIDLIAMLRPTLSPGLYTQMAGRGMRVKSHTDHCLVLDFAGNVSAHGPITAVKPPRKGKETKGDAPVKVCDNCNELVHLSVMVCPSCGEPFPPPKPKTMKLHDDDIMGSGLTEMTVTSWTWAQHTSRASGKEMVKVKYYGCLSDPIVTEYFPVEHDGYAGGKARAAVYQMIAQTWPGHTLGDIKLEALATILNEAKPPKLISYSKDGKFFRVRGREW